MVKSCRKNALRNHCQANLNKESFTSSDVLFMEDSKGDINLKNVFRITEKLEVAVLLIDIKPLSNPVKRNS